MARLLNNKCRQDEDSVLFIDVTVDSPQQPGSSFITRCTICIEEELLSVQERALTFQPLRIDDHEHESNSDHRSATCLLLIPSNGLLVATANFILSRFCSGHWYELHQGMF